MKPHNIHTTVNLGMSDAVFLDKNAEKLGMPRSRLLVLLMRKMLVHWKQMKRNFSSVKYQKNTAGEEWKVVHVFLEAGDYEVFIDMRKFFKRSVSALVAMAIKKYLKEIIADGKDDIKGYCDNYKLIGYQFDGKLDKNCICWHITWELDNKFARKLSL